MNILNWFKRGGNTPPEVTEPATEPEPIGDLAKNIVKLFDEDKISFDHYAEKRFLCGFLSESYYAIDGTLVRLIYSWQHDSIGPCRIFQLGDYTFNDAEFTEIDEARKMREKRQDDIVEKKKNERIAALKSEIASIAHPTTQTNTNAD